MPKDMASNIKAVRAISPVSVADNTAAVSQIIDTANFNSLTFLIALGSIADADATFAILVEESADSGFSTSNAVADDDLIGTEAGAVFQFDDDNECRKIGYIGSKRYVRLTITPSGNASAALLSAIALLGFGRSLPQSSQAT